MSEHTINGVIFKAIPSIPDYGVSRDGKVIRLAPRKTGKSKPLSWLPRWEKNNQYCYLVVGMFPRGSKRGHPTIRVVSRLVLEAWVGPPPQEGMHAAHKDGNPFNNRLENLYWATPKENIADQYRHGTHMSLNAGPG